MKQKLLALAMVLASFMPAVAETMKVGSTSYTITRTEKQLASGVKYTHLLFDRSYSGYTGGSSVHVVEADLTDPTVSLEMANPGALTGTKTLSEFASGINTSSRTVVAGANGSFWCTASSEKPWYTQMKGMPFGVTIKNGEMWTEMGANKLKHCKGPTRTGMLAVDQQGRVYIDKLKAQTSTHLSGSGFYFSAKNTTRGGEIALDLCNRVVHPSSASIYTRNYGTAKKFKPVVSTSDHSISSGSCTEVILDLAPGCSWNIGGATKLVVKAVRKSANQGTLGNHDLAIVGRGTTYTTNSLNKYQVGDEVELITKFNFANGTSPSKVEQALSGNIIAMRNGSYALSSSDTEAYNKNLNERTLYATNSTGTKLWILVCEHNVKKTKKYIGWTTSQMCDIAKTFGATEAMQPDCGGSAQMYAGGQQVSQSYDASGVRAVYNGLFVVSNPNGTGGVTGPSIKADKNNLTFSGEQGSTNPQYIDVKITGEYLTEEIKYNSSSRAVTVAPLSDWNSTTGGTLRLTLDTSQAAGSYSGYVAVQSSSTYRIEVYFTATIAAGSGSTTPPVDPNGTIGDDYLNATPGTFTLSGMYQSSVKPYADIVVKGSNLTKDISYNSSSSVVSVTPLDGWNATTGGTLRMTLNTDFSLGEGTYTGDDKFVAIQSTADHRILVKFTATLTPNDGTTTEPEPTDPEPEPEPGVTEEEVDVTGLTEKWIYSTNKGNLASAPYFSSADQYTRDMCFADGKLYVLNASTSATTVNILDAYTGAKTATLNTDGISGGTYALSNIKSLGSTVMGSNMATASETLKVYTWVDDTTEPELLFEDTSHGGVEVGRTMNTYGDMQNGIIAFGHLTKIVYYTVKNGIVNTTANTIDIQVDGNASNQSVAFLEDGTFWLDNKDTQPIHYKTDGTVISTLAPDSKYLKYGVGMEAFTYGKRKYIALTPTLGSTASSTWGNGSLMLVNVNDEANPIVIGNTTYPADGLGAASWGGVGNTAVDHEITSDNSLNLWVMVPCQGIAMYQFAHSGSTTTPNPDIPDNPDTPDTPTMNDNVTSLTEVWNYSQVSGNTANWITNGSQVTQDMAAKDGKLYVVHRNGDNSDNKIYIVNAYTGAKIGELNTSACTTGTYAISSIENFGGKIIATSLAASGTEALTIYAWDNDNAAPSVLLSTSDHNGVRVGDALSVSGDMTNGKIWFSTHGGTSVFYYTVKNGVCSTTPTVINLTKAGAAFTVNGSTTANVTVESDGSFWVSSKDYTSTHFNASGEFIEELALSNKQGSDFKIITLGSKKYVAGMTYLNKSSSTIAEGAFQLLNITDGIAGATAVGTYPAAGLGTTRNTSFRNTLCYEVSATDLNIWTLVPMQGAAYYKFKHSDVSGVEDLFATPAEELPVEWYNLQGVRIDGENLVPGIYIRRQGSTVGKVLVK